ncbi:hypothetical protein GE061_010482 [Apolygus lucorum]|uniref:Uncharacterized protein n=1 Tax=Apolygus lucorum TaxID=248454 RepID=A0A6A4JJF8_APOLU|nr:hypothetical protein GE061_010482 [Apolygus lucorum]
MFGVGYFAVIFSIFFTDVAFCGRREFTRHIVTGSHEFPYLCSVDYKNNFVFACSILTKNVVVVSVSNMNQVITRGKTPRYYNDIGSLAVIAGSPYRNPSQFENLPPGAQRVKVHGFFTGRLALTEANCTDYDLTTFMKFKLFDTAPKINFGFLRTVRAFVMSRDVVRLPLMFKFKRLLLRTENIINHLEGPDLPLMTCKIAGWDEQTSRKVFHHVMYVPKPLCRIAYCGYNVDACFGFIDTSPEVCFKSAYWGGPCAKDTGSALFCKHFNGGNIFAILTTAINCEKGNLPCVYTAMTQVVSHYQKIFGETYEPSI